MKIMNIVKKNGKTIFGVVSGLAIAGVSLATAMNRKSDDEEDCDDYEMYPIEDDDVTTEDSSEEVSEE